MEPPPVQYVTTSDGYDIAYSVSGGGRPLVFLGAPLGGMGHLWRFSPEWMEGLSARFQLVQYDLRGHGMSERGLPADSRPAPDVTGLDAIVDRLRLNRFILFGLSGVGHAAVRYAALHPEQVEALVLNGTRVSMTMTSFYRGVSAENWEFFLRSFVPPSLEPQESQAWFESLRDSTTYDDWQIRARRASESNIEDDLPLLRVPTLVLHPREYALTSSEGARKLAAMIPGAQLVMISGDRMLGDAEEGIAAIERFLGELPPDRKAPAVAGGLSDREIEVLRLLAAGRSNQQIADELVISLNTVRRHVSNVFDKTGVANRTEASVYARDHGIG